MRTDYHSRTLSNIFEFFGKLDISGKHNLFLYFCIVTLFFFILPGGRYGFMQFQSIYDCFMKLIGSAGIASSAVNALAVNTLYGEYEHIPAGENNMKNYHISKDCLNKILKKDLKTNITKPKKIRLYITSKTLNFNR